VRWSASQSPREYQVTSIVDDRLCSTDIALAVGGSVGFVPVHRPLDHIMLPGLAAERTQFKHRIWNARPAADADGRRAPFR
jgi:hypothetical protein